MVIFLWVSYIVLATPLLKLPINDFESCLDMNRGVTNRCRLQYLGCPKAPSYMSPNASGREGVAGSQPLSLAVTRSPN